MQLTTNTAFQTAWVVADFDEAVDYWSRIMGVGPFFVLNFESGPALRYRGAPGELRMRVAWAQAGDTQIELIEPLSDAPNVYRDLVRPGETRFHHLCFWSTDIEADGRAMTRAGFATAMESGPSASRFAYFDTSAVNGHMIEILERQEGTVGLFDRIKTIAADWNGERPVREFAELMA